MFYNFYRTLNEEDNTISLILHNGKVVTLATETVGIEEVSRIKVTSKQTIIEYSNGSTKTITQAKEDPAEFLVSRNLLLEKLSSQEFIIELKDAGYIFRKQTIEKVITAIKEWKENEGQRLRLTGNAKKLYDVATELLGRDKPIEEEHVL